MPHVTRLAQKRQATEMRATGEQVTLLIQAGAPPSTTTPDNISAADVSINLNAITQVFIYAHVRWHDLGVIQYGEAGRDIIRKCSIETTSEWAPYLAQTVSVILEDGSIMEKVSESMSETNAVYTIEVQGKQNISQ